MATEVIYFTGKGAYINAHKINQWGKWDMKLYPDVAGIELFKKLQEEKGIQNELSKDDEGWFIRLGRKANITVRGKLVGQQPPMVFDGRKPLPGGGYAPLLEPIGNGSDVLAKVEVYSFNTPRGGKGHAMKWAAVRVDNLVPFDNASIGQDMAKAGEGLDQQPSQLF